VEENLLGHAALWNVLHYSFKKFPSNLTEQFYVMLAHRIANIIYNRPNVIVVEREVLQISSSVIRLGGTPSQTQKIAQLA
jgi:hypothetical protein